MKEPGMIIIVSYVALFITNALIVSISQSVFPDNIVLGTNSISYLWSLIHSIGTLTLVNTFAIPFIHRYETSAGRILSPAEWMWIYFVLNFVGIWIITRFADQVGLGISSWIVAALLAIVLDITQGIVMMQLEKYKNKLT